MHNYYRSLHNSPPLSCDPALATSAQQWTDQQAENGVMSHSEWTDQYTESLSWKGEGWLGRYITTFKRGLILVVIVAVNC